MKKMTTDLTVEILKTDEDFEALLPLIKKVSSNIKTPFSQLVQEVSASVRNPPHLTLLLKSKKEIKAYLSGWMINQLEFYISQIFSRFPFHTKMLLEHLEKEVRKTGGEVLIGYSFYPERTFSRYGFVLERFLISKKITKKED